MRVRNRDLPKRYYTVATATNGVLTSGGRVIGNTGNATSNGAFLVVKSGGCTLAMRSNVAKAN
jgi:hypothetical protein